MCGLLAHVDERRERPLALAMTEDDDNLPLEAGPDGESATITVGGRCGGQDFGNKGVEEVSI